MGFINWHILANKKSHMVNLVSVILPEKIQMTKKKLTFHCFFYAVNNNAKCASFLNNWHIPASPLVLFYK